MGGTGAMIRVLWAVAAGVLGGYAVTWWWTIPMMGALFLIPQHTTHYLLLRRSIAEGALAHYVLNFLFFGCLGAAVFYGVGYLIRQI